MCSVLESLEQEYRRDEDWCGSHDKLGVSADSDHLLPLISKHLEQKEAFLKVSDRDVTSENTLLRSRIEHRKEMTVVSKLLGPFLS